MNTPETLAKYFNDKNSSPVNWKIHMNVELLRFSSFENLPKSCPVSIIRLAEAGFYYVGPGDKVKCYKCDFTKENWKKGDNPFNVHKNGSPTCSLVCEEISDNIPVAPVENFRPCISNIAKLFIQESEVYNSMESVGSESRINSLIEPDGTSEHIRSVDSERSSSSREPANNISSDRSGGDQMRNRSSSGGSSNPGQSAIPRTGIRNPALNTDVERHHSVGSPRPRGPSLAQQNRSMSIPAGPLINVADSSSARRNSGPILRQQPEVPVHDTAFLRFERNRLETFKNDNWPVRHPVSPSDLARSGFFYVGKDDRVMCAFCRGILKNWDPGDQPHIEHKKSFPRCKFILGLDVGNVPLTTSYPEGGNRQPINQASAMPTIRPPQMEALGISTERPKYPNYAIEAQRLTSYQKWPSYKHQTPETLAAAGFFYAGFADNVKCFFCDGGLKNWEPGDDPWMEHARWFPKCTFLRNVKGEQYIQRIQERFNVSSRHIITVAGRSAQAAGQRHKVEEREIKARMDLPMVRTVLSTGIEPKVVMQAIRNRLQQSGDDFPNVEALMNAALELSENPEQLNAVVSSSSATNAATASASTSNSDEIPAEKKKKKIESESESAENSSDLNEEVRQLKEQKLCKICLDEEVGMVFLPCGHLCCCVKCGPAVQQCPICRTNIRGTVRTYMS